MPTPPPGALQVRPDDTTLPSGLGIDVSTCPLVCMRQEITPLHCKPGPSPARCQLLLWLPPAFLQPGARLRAFIQTPLHLPDRSSAWEGESSLWKAPPAKSPQ